MGRNIHKHIRKTAPKYLQIFYYMPPGHTLSFPCTTKPCPVWKEFWNLAYRRGFTIKQKHKNGEHLVQKIGSSDPYHIHPIDFSAK